MTVAAADPLENPVWSALVGPHRELGYGTARARAYRPEYAPFAGLRDTADDRDWSDLARVVGPSGMTAVAGSQADPPAGWRVEASFAALQMVARSAFRTGPEADTIALGEAEADEMADLASRTEPGPFRARTWQMGSYLGLRMEGRLVAMAGERMHLPGWTEISAVCTDPAFRGRGLAGRLVRAVGAGIEARGERVLLHVLTGNVGAVRLYERLGFEVRRPLTFLFVQAPP